MSKIPKNNQIPQRNRAKKWNEKTGKYISKKIIILSACLITWMEQMRFLE